jgi:hypothetical protein
MSAKIGETACSDLKSFRELVKRKIKELSFLDIC